VKVAIVVANIAARYGGPARAATAYAEALSGAGCDVRLVTTDQDGRSRLRVPLGRLVPHAAGYDTLYCSAGPRSSSRPFSAAFARGIDRAAAWADVMHVSSLYLPHNLFARRACLRHGIPYVVRPHGTLEPYQRTHSHRLKRAFDAVYGKRYLAGAAAYHFTDRSEASAAGDVVPASRSFVVPVPVAMPAETAPVATNRDVLVLGRVAAKKRLDLVLDAWAAVRPDRPDMRLVIAGPVDPDQRHLIARAHREAQVHVFDTVAGADKEALLRGAALFLLPSDNENFGVAVAEAMSFGVPVVITRGVALAPLVERSRAGTVVPNGDGRALASAVGHLLDRSDARTAMGAAARETVRRQLGSAEIGRHLRRALAEVSG
jgi:glycosyltransferase involved in cell wall biosynthesis